MFYNLNDYQEYTMRKYMILILVAALALGIAGCRNEDSHAGDAHDDHGHGHGGSAVVVTLWTDQSELFMEYPPLVAGKSERLIVHLTVLETFDPVHSGTLTVEFSGNGSPYRVTSHEPARDGIYLPEVTLPEEGTYQMTIQIESGQVKDRFVVGDVQVYQSEGMIPHEEESGGGEEVSFLKEQQWKTEFGTGMPQAKSLNASVRARGEILPTFGGHAQIPAPAAGFADPGLNANAPQVGEWVKKGQVLATITPPASSQVSFADIRSNYLKSKAEYERAQRLLEKEAASERRVRDARLEFEAAKASYNAVTGQESSVASGSDALNYTIRSPLDGIVDLVGFKLGEEIAPGQPLFTITDPRRVRLEVMLPVSLYGMVDEVSDAAFIIEGTGKKYLVSELDGKLLSEGHHVNRQSRTIPVVFEMDNPEQRLKINMFAQVFIYTGKTIDAMSIPDSAILDDNGQPVVYVQTEGESFIRKEIETGVRDRGFTEVLSGLGPDERVVTAGAYQVRLASLSSAVPSAHVH